MTANDVTVCREALALLRQEVELADDSWTAPTTKAEKACRRAYDYTRRAFLASHDWNFARTYAAQAAWPADVPAGAVRVVDVVDSAMSSVMWKVEGGKVKAPSTGAYVAYTADAEDVTTWPPLERAAFVAYLARELCLPMTGRQEDLKAVDALARERFDAARLADLREGSPANDQAEEVLGLLRQHAGLSGDAAADSVMAATRRFGVFETSATDEVLAAHDWGLASGQNDYAHLPKLAQSAVLVLVAHKIAVRCGAGAEQAKALYAMYEAKLREARVKSLSDGVAARNDGLEKEVLARLLGEFEGEKALGFNVTAYTSRIAAVKTTVLGALNAAHSWGSTYTEQTLPGDLKEVYVLGICAALAGTVGVPAERAAAYAQAYEAKLREARVKSLSDGVAARSDTLEKEVLARLLGEFEGDKALGFNVTAYTSRIAAVKTTVMRAINTSHQWWAKEDGVEVVKTYTEQTLPGDLNEVYVLGICAALAGTVGVPAERAAAYTRAYEERLHAARVKNLYSAVLGTEDATQREVLARLLGEHAESDKAIGTHIAVYRARIDRVKGTVLGAIKGAHEWGATYTTENDLPNNLREVHILGICAAVAGSLGFPKDHTEAYARAYEAKLREARVKNLHERLAANQDPVLAELLGNFKADDAALVHVFTVYTSRAAAAKAAAEAEVEAAHEWPELGTGEAARLSALKAAAANARALEALSVVAGGGEESARRYAKEYESKLRAARAYALERETPPAGIAGEVAAVLRPVQDAGDGAMPFSLASIGRRVDELLATARREVMTAHRWNFARETVPLRAAPGPDGTALVARPAGCVRVESVKTPHGDACSWTMRGEWIAARGPVGSVTYIREVEDVDEWPPPVRRCLVLRLASMIRLAGEGEAERGRLAAEYAKALSDAAVQDAREGNRGREAWGRGLLRAEAAFGRDRRWPCSGR